MGWGKENVLMRGFEEQKEIEYSLRFVSLLFDLTCLL